MMAISIRARFRGSPSASVGDRYKPRMFGGARPSRHGVASVGLSGPIYLCED